MTMTDGGAGSLGRGGMTTKLAAAKLAARSGAVTVIASGARLMHVLGPHSQPAKAGRNTARQLTWSRLVARKRWIAGQLRTTGELVLDDGAVTVLRSAGRSLLPVGVTATRVAAIREVTWCCAWTAKVRAVAKGLVNYADNEVVEDTRRSQF